MLIFMQAPDALSGEVNGGLKILKTKAAKPKRFLCGTEMFLARRK
jgi:hypothetical protein